MHSNHPFTRSTYSNFKKNTENVFLTSKIVTWNQWKAGCRQSTLRCTAFHRVCGEYLDAKSGPATPLPKQAPAHRRTYNHCKHEKMLFEVIKNGPAKNWKVTFFGPFVFFPKITKKNKKNIKKQALQPKLKSVPKTTSITVCMPIFLEKQCKKKWTFFEPDRPATFLNWIKSRQWET